MPLPPLVMAEAVVFNVCCSCKGSLEFVRWPLGLASSFEGYRNAVCLYCLYCCRILVGFWGYLLAS